MNNPTEYKHKGIRAVPGCHCSKCRPELYMVHKTGLGARMDEVGMQETKLFNLTCVLYSGEKVAYVNITGTDIADAIDNVLAIAKEDDHDVTHVFQTIN